MQYYKCISIGLLVLTLFTTGACRKSFLEVVPKGQNIAVTLDDYNMYMNNSSFYLPNRADFSITWYAAVMGDEVASEAAYFNHTGSGTDQARNAFEWKDDIFPLDGTSSDASAANPRFLTNFLSNLYSLNVIINGVMGATGGTEAQKLGVQAEAMTHRALMYYYFLNYFAQPYNPGTAATDPGFPIITVADITSENFERSNVQACYDFIINDLTAAIANLPVSQPIRTRVTKSAAEALLGKVYLSMAKYTEALSVLKNAFNDMTTMANAPALYDYNKTLAPGGAFLPISPVNGPNSPFLSMTDISESVWAVFNYSGTYTGRFLTITQSTAALFHSTDWRLQFYSNLQDDQLTPIQGGRLRRYNQLYSRIGIQLPDLYLMKAEAEARTGDLSAAAADVETLRKNRMPALIAAVPVSIAADQVRLVKFIIEERIREFATEGVRWFDMRRLSADPLFAGQPAAQHVVYDDDMNGTIYTLKPERLTMKIPPLYLQQNPGMVDNP